MNTKSKTLLSMISALSLEGKSIAGKGNEITGLEALSLITEQLVNNQCSDDPSYSAKDWAWETYEEATLLYILERIAENVGDQCTLPNELSLNSFEDVGQPDEQ